MKASVKYLAVYGKREKYPIQTMCQFFGVSRSGYYDYIKRIDNPDYDEPLAAEIARCQEHSRKTYGYRRVQLWLEQQGIHRNPKTVLRIMRKYGLLSEIRRRRKYRVKGQQFHRYENLLGRDFTAHRPNQKWVTDISYIHTMQGVLYLSIIRGLFDNSIVAYKTRTNQSVGLVLDTIRDAMQKEKAAGELQLHSDQGFQYTSHAYFSLTKEYGMIPPMSRRGNCYDNAMAKNFFSILKLECMNRHKLSSFSQARSLIDDFIWFYNNERIQLKTKLTPLQKRRQLA